jgi:benzylsuccinate CoA-transferase BbsF subunit
LRREDMKKLPFEGVKIADFTWVIAGPHTIHYLTDHGATTVHIESSTRPDLDRFTGPMRDNIMGLDRGTRVSLHHRGKLSLTLNLPDPKGREVALRLVKWADIVADNFAPGAMDRLGLGYEELKKVKPDIIMMSLSNLGSTGPEATQPGYGTVLVAQAGFNNLTGYPDGAPVPNYSAYTDYTTPPMGAAALIAALDYKRRTGKGQYIDVSQMESGLHFLAPALLDYAANGRVQTRNGNKNPGAAPHGCYRCKGKERWCVIAVFTDEEWQSFCKVIGSPAWTKDGKFSTFLGRKKNEDELDSLIEKWTIDHTSLEVMKMMQNNGIAAGPVEDAKDLFEDPQLKHREHFAELYNPVVGKHHADGIPFKLSKTPGVVGNPALLGEHNEYVCTKLLGMSDEEFVSLMEEGILK